MRQTFLFCILTCSLKQEGIPDITTNAECQRKVVQQDGHVLPWDKICFQRLCTNHLISVSLSFLGREILNLFSQLLSILSVHIWNLCGESDFFQNVFVHLLSQLRCCPRNKFFLLSELSQYKQKAQILSRDTVDSITATQCSCFTLCSSSCQLLHLDSTELVVSSSSWCGKWASAKTVFAESFISGKVQMSALGAQQATFDKKHLASYSASGHKSLVSVFRIISKCQELTYLRCQHFF